MMSFTTDEMAIIRASITLPYVVELIDSNVAELQNGKNVLRRMYAMMGWTLLQQARQELYDSRRGLSQLQIRVTRIAEIDGIPHFKASRNGIEKTFGISKDVMRGEVADHIRRLSAELGSHFKQHG